jgi:predicted nucleotide-binding protein
LFANRLALKSVSSCTLKLKSPGKIFVADVAINEDSIVKSYPNANVIFELSYALQRKQQNQIIIVRRKREDIATTDVPFDFRQYRHIAYTTPKQLKSHLKSTIIQTLEKMGYIRAFKNSE